MSKSNGYDFDTAPHRRGYRSLKWDICKKDDVIPLWVADMDFKICDAVERALRKRLDHGVCGYGLIDDLWYEAVINWQQRRNGVLYTKKQILAVPGVIPALSAVLQALLQPSEQVIMQTPAYNCFYSSLRNCGIDLLKNPLKEGARGYELDFEDLEAKLSSDRARALLLCNPHNPTGRIWTRDELMRIASLCEKYDITVIADEIHSDLRSRDSVFTSFATLNSKVKTVTLNAPSKAFNLAGLQCAYIMSKEASLLREIDRRVNINEICDLNVFGIEALIAAYNEGEGWLESLNDYIRENLHCAYEFFAKELPQVKIFMPQSTYLMWLDLRSYGLSSDELFKKFLEAGVMLSRGSDYGIEGDGFMRLNVACPQDLLLKGLERIKKALQQI